jgi:hypothetical protein
MATPMWRGDHWHFFLKKIKNKNKNNKVMHLFWFSQNKQVYSIENT